VFRPTRASARRLSAATIFLLTMVAALLTQPLEAQPVTAAACSRTVIANVVALDQPFFWNRLGVMQPWAMIFALERDVISKDGGPLAPGNVRVRDYKRPRPLVLRVNVGECLQVNFTNLLDPFQGGVRPSGAAPDPVTGLFQDFGEQPATRNTSVHVIGMQLVGGIASDGSNVGRNPSSLVAPGGSRTYTLYAEREGTYFLYGNGATTGGEGDGGSISAGLFGAVNVEPRNSEYYRSQVTRDAMTLASTATTVDGLPILDYDATYDAGHPIAHGETGIPILNLLKAPGGGSCAPGQDGCEIVHSDLTAVITGANRGYWASATDPDACASDPAGFPTNAILANRCEPFREYTIIFHDELGARQMLPGIFNDPVLGHTLHSVKDGFAINYGTGGIGAEILANRLAVGPMWNCPECKYEEFFLSSWIVGDPAMVVDVPANAVLDANGLPVPGPHATKALYPDDPSNVYHSYLGDRVKFRNIHAGPKEHHIFHLHAHQWVNSSDADEGAYLDSQSIGPGSGHTYEITYNGSGNRNKTPADAIFHCHFYPHFAQGMWAMWRNHDTFEWGTLLDADGRPAAGELWQTRALPDGEIAAGVPSVGLVPLPGKPMAPAPTAAFPGYPYYIPGVAGHRPPQPPLDFAKEADGTAIDGGLPRHVVINTEADAAALLNNGRMVQTDLAAAAGALTVEAGSHPNWLALSGQGGISEFPVLNRLDFAKESVELNAAEVPEGGTPAEIAAMNFHATRSHPTIVQPTHGGAASPGSFITNGLPAQPGAPFADPCVDDQGGAVGTPIRYQAASIQVNAKYTKNGWHNQQHRMISLWQDVGDVMADRKAPEPFFFRANTDHCITFWLTNLLPKQYELDDFQVRTPTDIMGQHIHLVKFDVSSSDGGTNGWNYEDGTFSPQEVTERIHAINVGGGLLGLDGVSRGALTARAHPFFKNVAEVTGNRWGNLALGAQTTIQRWYADNVVDRNKKDRTLRTVYTHDHYAPSTQQQAGYYAGLVVEPQGSVWRDNQTGDKLGPNVLNGSDASTLATTVNGPRQDGGPTSWQAAIDMTAAADATRVNDSYREFMVEFGDMTMAYQAGHGDQMVPVMDEVTNVTLDGFSDLAGVVNPPVRNEQPHELLVKAPLCPGGVQRPCPEAISADDAGLMIYNYRSEPIALRVADKDPLQGQPSQASGTAGDLSHAFRSDVVRKIPALNTQPGFYPPLTPGKLPGDPYTPLLRVFEGDKVQIRQLVGAQEEGHNFNMNGMRWLFDPSWRNSGYRSNQMVGISEHFEFEVAPLQAVKGGSTGEDYLITPGTAIDNLWTGTWGLMRVYSDPASAPDLWPLPNNSDGKSPRNVNASEFQGVCPSGGSRRNPAVYNPDAAPVRNFSIIAVLARDVLPEGTLVYNSRGEVLHDPSAILYVQKGDLDKKGKLKAGLKAEPLVIRANAGDCITVTLESRVTNPPDPDGWSTYPMITDGFNANDVHPSGTVGLHASLLEYDMNKSDGMNVGINPEVTTTPGGPVAKYQWYAGKGTVCLDRYTIAEHPECFPNGTQVPEGVRIATPVEFGAVPLMPADRIEQASKGAVGMIIVEPKGSSWVEDAGTRTSATVTKLDGTQFRDFAVVWQDAVNLQRGAPGSSQAVRNTAEAEDPEDSGQKGLNYRTEPMWHRLGFEPDARLQQTRNLDFSNALSNSQVGGDPQTPVFTADKGTPVRFRVVNGGGHARNHVFALHGHIWQELPWVNNSTELGENREAAGGNTGNSNNRWMSEFKGVQWGIGAGSHFNIIPQNGAGGIDQVTGDFLLRDQASFQFDGGIWGILRVCATGGNSGNTQCQ